MTPGPQPGSCRFESGRGYLKFVWSWGSLATPPASGAGDARSNRADQTLRCAARRRLSAPLSGRAGAPVRPSARYIQEQCIEAVRGGGIGYLASLMSSSCGFESRPRYLGDVAQR